MPRTSTDAPGVPDPAWRLDDQIGFLLRRAYQRAGGNLVAEIGGRDLTPQQFATLARLLECGPVSQNRLGRLVAMEPPNIRDVVQRLVRRGLADAGRDPTDARRVLVGLTPRGRDLVGDLIAAETRATERTLAPLSRAERAQLARLLRRVADAGSTR